MSHTILTDILIVFIVAVPVAYLFHKLKLPPIIGFLVTGALIGPAGIGLVQDIDRINLLAQVGVALLVFSLGLEFSLKHFGEIKRVVIGGGILQILLTAFSVIVLALSLGISWQNGILLGLALSLSSTAIVYYILSQQRLMDSPHGRIATGILVFQDLSSIPMIALLPLLSMSSGSIDGSDISIAVFKIIAVAGTFLLGRRFIIPWVLHRITLTRSKELFLVTILLIALGFGFLTNEMGLSFALGAFLAGLMIADTDFRFHALSEIAPFRYCFNGLFFVSIGMLFHPAFLASHWGLIAVILLVLPIGKALISTLAISLLGYPVNVAAMAGLSLSQVGEFSFLILLIARKAGVIPEPLYDFTIAAAFLTILITPAVMRASPALVNFIERILPLKWIRGRKRLAAINAEELKNHVIICGFGPLGSSVGHILEEAEREYLVLELNPATVRKIKNLRGGRPVYLGDGASAEILYKSGIERASALAITAPDYMNSVSIIKQARIMNPELKIITRARFRSQVSELYAAGADIVISEELEAGIEMGRYILLHMGVDEATIEQYIQTIRAFGSADFF
ncbi:MAG: cation:proton antiporter [Deltaproteobacteria bacterium]|nr:cation:proton antiporter [Deltaproteobacteria bacterium]